jgi:hypothetical protein
MRVYSDLHNFSVCGYFIRGNIPCIMHPCRHVSFYDHNVSSKTITVLRNQWETQLHCLPKYNYVGARKFFVITHSYIFQFFCVRNWRQHHRNITVTRFKGKDKTIPLQAWTSTEVPRRLSPSDFKTIGGRFVSPTHRPFPPGNIPGSQFSFKTGSVERTDFVVRCMCHDLYCNKCEPKIWVSLEVTRDCSLFTVLK